MQPQPLTPPLHGRRHPFPCGARCHRRTLRASPPLPLRHAAGASIVASTWNATDRRPRRSSSAPPSFCSFAQPLECRPRAGRRPSVAGGEPQRHHVPRRIPAFGPWLPHGQRCGRARGPRPPMEGVRPPVEVVAPLMPLMRQSRRGGHWSCRTVERPDEPLLF